MSAAWPHKSQPAIPPILFWPSSVSECSGEHPGGSWPAGCDPASPSPLR